jgi:hypothetical protein
VDSWVKPNLIELLVSTLHDMNGTSRGHVFKAVWYEIFFITQYCYMDASVRLLVGRHRDRHSKYGLKPNFLWHRFFTSVYIVVLLLSFF